MSAPAGFSGEKSDSSDARSWCDNVDEIRGGGNTA